MYAFTSFMHTTCMYKKNYLQLKNIWTVKYLNRADDTGGEGRGARAPPLFF